MEGMKQEKCKEIANTHSSQFFRFDTKGNCMWLTIYQILFVLFSSCNQTFVIVTFPNRRCLQAIIKAYTPTLRQEKCIFVSGPSKQANNEYNYYHKSFAELYIEPIQKSRSTNKMSHNGFLITTFQLCYKGEVSLKLFCQLAK